MPGPTTEVLNEDLKDLKREIHERHDLLRRDFHELGISFAGLRGELKVTLNIMKYAGVVLVTTFLTSGVAEIWGASEINARVKALEVRVDERIGELGSRMDERFKAVDARLDRLESLIIKALDQGRTAMQSKKSEAGADAPVK